MPEAERTPINTADNAGGARSIHGGRANEDVAAVGGVIVGFLISSIYLRFNKSRW